MNDARIVWVEDSEDEVAVALRALRRAGLDRDVVVLRDGREALDWFERCATRRRRPQVVFLDLSLPRVDGKRVLETLRENEATCDVPVVILSSTRRDEEIEECYKLGANSFISKPYGEGSPGEYLVRAARYWLDLNRTPRPGSHGSTGGQG